MTTALVEVECTAHHYGSSDIDVTDIVLFCCSFQHCLSKIKTRLFAERVKLLLELS